MIPCILLTICVTHVLIIMIEAQQEKTMCPAAAFDMDGRDMVMEVAPLSGRARLIGPLIWVVPVGCDFSGFLMEVLGYLVGLHEVLLSGELFVDVGQCSHAFLCQLEPSQSSCLQGLQESYQRTKPDWSRSIVVHHKLPGAPFPQRLTQQGSGRPLLAVGRMMSESVYLDAAEVRAAGQVDQVWVPTHWQAAVFERHGVSASKLFVLPEAVNVDFFSATPGAVAEIKADAEADVEAVTWRSRNSEKPPPRFRFVSVFKWEWRKGYDILLSAYWAAFTPSDGVELVIRSYKPSWLTGPRNLVKAMEGMAQRWHGVPMSELAPVRWISEPLSRRQLRELYTSGHAFVLPTRGEGWCLPCVEAMASGLPAIVTNASGPTEYMSADVGWPLAVRGTLHRDGTAEPDAAHLQQCMREAVAHPAEAASRGRAAQQYVRQHYHPRVLARRIVTHLQQS